MRQRQIEGGKKGGGRGRGAAPPPPRGVRGSLAGRAPLLRTGAVLAAELNSRGYKVICVYSASLKQMENLLSLIPEGIDLTFDAIIDFFPEPDITIAI